MRCILKTLVLAGALMPAGFPGAVSAQETDLTFWGVQFDKLEYRAGDEGEDLFVYGGDAFYGSDEWKLRWTGEGEIKLDEDEVEALDNRLVVQTPVSSFFDAKVGVRVDTPTGSDRWYGVVGIQGLAPQWFEIDADLFVSETADVSARLEAEYELLLTNRLILVPSVELDVAFTEDQEIGVGRGLSAGEFGLRLGYDAVDRAVSPYIGVVYEKKFFDTADFARTEGEDTQAWFGTIGMRVMF